MTNTSTKKIRVAVLYGGRSPEHEVSILSATNIIASLDRSRFEVIPIKIDKQGTWFLEDKSAVALPVPSPDLAEVSPQKLFTPSWLIEPEAATKSELAEIHRQLKSERLFDVVFPIMHGTFSEDGTIQGMLELADVPYVGCGVLASAVGMDKDVARRLVSHAGMQTVSYIAVKQDQWKRDAACIEAQVAKMFSLPIFVKPANQGSSIGVTKVKKMEDLADAIWHAFRYDNKILIEQGVPAIELEVSILESLEEGAPPFASIVGEARPTTDEFYSYAAKYTEGGVDLLIPAEIPEAVQQEARSLSQKVFTTLGAEGIARIDFFMDKNTQQLYFNEMNTMPGFTPFSMYPQVIVASGISYSDLLTQLVMLAIKKFEQKQCLERSYV